jgi:hypothetical protein
MTMLKKLIATSALALGLTAGAQAQTIVLLPEPGSLEPATVIVDPKASARAPVLVCASLSQLTTGGCALRSWAQDGLRRP